MNKPWLKMYGDSIPAEINPDVAASVVDLLDDAIAT